MPGPEHCQTVTFGVFQRGDGLFQCIADLLFSPRQASRDGEACRLEALILRKQIADGCRVGGNAGQVPLTMFALGPLAPDWPESTCQSR